MKPLTGRAQLPPLLDFSNFSQVHDELFLDALMYPCRDPFAHILACMIILLLWLINYPYAHFTKPHSVGDQAHEFSLIRFFLIMISVPKPNHSTDIYWQAIQLWQAMYCSYGRLCSYGVLELSKQDRKDTHLINNFVQSLMLLWLQMH